MKEFLLIILSAILLLYGCKKEDSESIKLAPASVTVSSEAGSFELKISCITPWVITCSEDWCTFSTNSGNANSTLIVNYTVNNSTSTRVATITIKTEGHNETMNVTQQGKLPGSNPIFGEYISSPFGISDEALDVSFIDIDNDGDCDMFSTSGIALHYFENVGNNNNPHFSESSPFGISEVASGIDFADIDGDGDYDMFTISGYGIHYIKNIGTKDNPNFAVPISSPFGISEIAYSVDLVDIDDDGDFDIFTSSGLGIHFFKNVGTRINPEFTNSVSSPFGISDPALAVDFTDIDGDGDFDLFNTSGLGTHFLRNIGAKNNPVFSTPVESPFGLSEAASGINFVDIDNDVDFDVFTISGSGTHFFENLNY